MGRSPCCDDNGLKKGPWTPEEDQKLLQYIHKHGGHGSWRTLPKLAGLNRCGKSCRLRWTNYLRPDIKRGKFSPEEEQTILNLHSILGNKWSAIAMRLPGRTDNEIKNFWNTHLKKKLIQMGFDPMTHQPRTDFLAVLPRLLALAQLHELMERQPWDGHGARIQAEADQAVKLQYFQYLLQLAAAMSTSPNTNSLGPLTAATTASPPMASFPSEIFPNDQVSQIEESQNRGSFLELNVIAGNPQDCSYTVLGQGEDYGIWRAPPLLADLSVTNAGDGCGTSSCGGCVATPLPWPELLLDDPFMAEFS